MTTNSFYTVVKEHVDKKTGNKCKLYICENTIQNEVKRKFFLYDVFLTDCCPYHDLLIGVCHEVYAEDEYPTKKERYSTLNKAIERNLEYAFIWYDHLIISGYLPCKELCHSSDCKWLPRHFEWMWSKHK